MGKRPKHAWKDEIYVRKHVELSKKLYESSRLSFDEHVFHASLLIEDNHEDSIVATDDRILAEISKKIDAVQRNHGLKPDEYWARGDGPEEYNALNAQWERRADELLYRHLKDFGADDIADLFKNSRSEFDVARERGRRAFFHKGETLDVIDDFIDQYMAEADVSSRSKSYTAALVLVGAATEALLLARCIKAKRKSISIAKGLPKPARPSKTDDPLRWTFENLISVCSAAGWLSIQHTENAALFPDGLAHQLRLMRNYQHAGRVCVNRPWFRASQRDYDLALSIFQVLKKSVRETKARSVPSNNSFKPTR